jgi:hypothetical protein
MGSGKSKLVNKIASLCGGAFAFAKNSEHSDMAKEMLSGENAKKRVAFLDNPKATLLSSDAIESMITAEQISGHQMFYGHASRPNHMTWFIAMNAANLSRDMAQRFVTIKLDKPEYSGDWNSDVDKFVSDHGEKVISGIQAFFKRPRSKLEKYNRWGLWQDQVLSRLEKADELAWEINRREFENDSDSKNAINLEDEIRTVLMKHGYSFPFSVHISLEAMRHIVSSAIGENFTKKNATDYVDRLIENRITNFLSRNPSRKFGRGFLLRNNHTDPICYDLDEKMKISRERFNEEKIYSEERVRQEVRNQQPY